MINHHHPSIELITLSFLNTGTQKKKNDTVLNAHLQAATTFIKTSVSLNRLKKALQILCWMQLQKKFKNLTLWLLFKMRLNCSCIEDIRRDTQYYYKISAFLSCQSRDKVINSHCRLQVCRITARPGDRAMRIIVKEFSLMQGLDMMLIRNTVFVDFTDCSAAFLQSKISVVHECFLTESTSKPLID